MQAGGQHNQRHHFESETLALSIVYALSIQTTFSKLQKKIPEKIFVCMFLMRKCDHWAFPVSNILNLITMFWFFLIPTKKNPKHHILLWVERTPIKNTSFLFWSWGLASIYSFTQPSSTTVYILVQFSVSLVKTFSSSTNKCFWSKDLKVWPSECKEIIQRETSPTDKKETESVAERFALRRNWKEKSRARAHQFNIFLHRLLLNFDSTVSFAHCEKKDTLKPLIN